MVSIANTVSFSAKQLSFQGGVSHTSYSVVPSVYVPASDLLACISDIGNVLYVLWKST